jgi:hypothetical protein
MTAITILYGEFEILFADEITVPATNNVGMRMVRRTIGATEVYYTTRELYSAIAEASDDFQAMGFENPMLPVTPNAYTMENQYFIPRSSTEYLSEGAITADWTVTAGVGVYMVAYTDNVPFDAGDIGRQILQVDSTDEGTLLDYEVLPDGTNVAWIRPNSDTDLFDGTGVLQVTTDSGTGTATASVAAVSGETLYASIQAIGSVPTATEVYVVQDRYKMTDWEGEFQWWATDPTVSLGIIDILMRVKNVDTLIAEGDVEVFSRKYTYLYDNFRLNVSAGGRSALPLASAADINNTTGYRTTGIMTGVGGTWTVGSGVYHGSTWATATSRGVVTETNSNTNLEYYLVGDLTDLTDTTAMKEYIFSTGIDGDATGTTATVAVNLTGPTDPAVGEGGTVTVVPAINNVDHSGDGVFEAYSITVDCQGPTNPVVAAKVYERLKYVTRRGATGADLFGSVTNIPGETYRGLSAIIEGDASTVDMTTEGQDLTSGTGNWTARLIAHNHTPAPALPGAGEYITVTDEQTSIDVVLDNYVISGGTEGDMTINTTDAPDFGIDPITSPKSSPLGTFTGAQIFGGRGVVFINPHPLDVKNYKLTDDLGNLNDPPNTVTFTVSNTIVGDRVLVARDTGTSGVIDKDQFGGLAAGGAAGDTTVTVTGTVDTEVPQVGYLRIVDIDLLEEHHYEYSSRTTGAGGVFTLTSAGSGTASAGSSTTMVDDGVNLVTGGATIGMLIRKTADDQLVYEITGFSQTGATPNDTADVVQLYGTPTAWSTDAYEINTLIAKHDSATATDYATTANIFDLILDLEATGTTASNSFIQSTTFNTVANVRQGKDILPFTANPDIDSSGGSVAVVRTEDTIAV